jgi:hypothetical protein
MVNASLPCQPDPGQRDVNRPSLSQARLAGLPNEPNNRRNPGEFPIVARPTNLMQVAGWCVSAHRPSLWGGAGTHSHGRMDPPNIRLRSNG